jgi:hypothetical protein
VLALLVSTFAAFALPTTIGTASAQEASGSRPAHASASASSRPAHASAAKSPASASAHAEVPRRARAGHRAKGPAPHRGAPKASASSNRGSGHSPTPSNERTDDGFSAQGWDDDTNVGTAGATQEKPTGPPPGQRGSGASDRARERANPSSPVGTAAPTPAAPVLLPEADRPEADRPARMPAPTSDAPLAASAPRTTPIAFPAAGSAQDPTVTSLGSPSLEGPLPSSSPAITTVPHGDVETPVASGGADRSGALDRSGAIGRSVLDAIRDGGTRSFQVPFLLSLALGGYLVLQRGFGRGSLPMVASDLPASVDPGPEAGADDVRYVL